MILGHLRTLSRVFRLSVIRFNNFPACCHESAVAPNIYLGWDRTMQGYLDCFSSAASSGKGCAGAVPGLPLARQTSSDLLICGYCCSCSLQNPVVSVKHNAVCEGLFTQVHGFLPHCALLLELWRWVATSGRHTHGSDSCARGHLHSR